MSAFSRFQKLCELVPHNYVQLQKGIIVIMSGFNFIKKKKKLNYINHWAVLLIYFDCWGLREGHLTITLWLVKVHHFTGSLTLTLADNMLDMSAITWAANECHWSCIFSVCHVPPQSTNDSRSLQVSFICKRNNWGCLCNMVRIWGNHVDVFGFFFVCLFVSFCFCNRT